MRIKLARYPPPDEGGKPRTLTPRTPTPAHPKLDLGSSCPDNVDSGIGSDNWTLAFARVSGWE